MLKMGKPKTIAEQLADIPEYAANEIISQAKILRNKKLGQEQAEKDEEKARIKKIIDSIPKKVLANFLKQIRELSNPQKTKISIGLTIELENTLVWDFSDAIYFEGTGDCKIQLDKSINKHLKNEIERYFPIEWLQDTWIETIDMLDPSAPDHPLPLYGKLQQKVSKLLDDMAACEEQYKLPSNAIWDQFVDDGKI